MNQLTFDYTRGSTSDFSSCGGGATFDIDGTDFLETKVVGGASPSFMKFTFPEDITAFGFDTMYYNAEANEGILFVTDNGQEIAFQSSHPQFDPGFIGIILDGASTQSVTIRVAQDGDVDWHFDNVVYVFVADSPMGPPTSSPVQAPTGECRSSGTGLFNRQNKC